MGKHSGNNTPHGAPKDNPTPKPNSGPPGNSDGSLPPVTNTGKGTRRK